MRGIARRMHLFENPRGFIYFVRMENMGPIKIGFTKNVRKRLYSLNTSTPFPLQLLLSYPADEEEEEEIHDGLREIRLNGEWFLPHPFLLKEIEQIKKIMEDNYE